MLAGGYVLRRAKQRPRVTLVGMGALLPEVLAAADVLGDDVDVLCVTSADLLFRAFRARARVRRCAWACTSRVTPSGPHASQPP